MTRKLSYASFALAAGAAAVISIAATAGAQTAAPGAAAGTASSTSALQAQLDANDQQIAALNQQIAQYQAALQQVGANKKTLQAAINALNLQKKQVQAQVNATQLAIQSTQIEIQQLGGAITNAQQSITDDQTALGAYLISLQKAEAKPLIQQMLSSGGLMATWNDLSQTLQIQDGISNEMQTLKTQKAALTSSQTASQAKQQTLTAQQQALAAQQQSLVQTEQSKTQLLAQTNAQESTYEQLLAAAEAELQSFSAFTQNAGGSKLLGNQTQCDAWGCYYSQRDALWGSIKLNNTQYTLAADGCLVTSLAMVLTHYGYHDVTPVTINSNPNNFAAYYPAYLLTTITVDGTDVTRRTAAIDASLAAGTPVIIGLHAYGGTHFVVFVSGSKGNYIMKDPYVQNGNGIPFASHYSLRSIFSVAKVVIG